MRIVFLGKKTMDTPDATGPQQDIVWHTTSVDREGVLHLDRASDSRASPVSNLLEINPRALLDPAAYYQWDWNNFSPLSS